MSLGFTEVFLVIVVALLLFGAKRIPEFAKALGRARYEFEKAKDSLRQEARELEKEVESIAVKQKHE